MIIDVPNHIVLRCKEYAQDKIRNGIGDKSLRYSILGAERNPIVWAEAKYSEWAVAEWLGLPESAIKFDPKAGAEMDGIDLTAPSGITIDVKTTSTDDLIWSAGKTHPVDTLPGKNFDVFVVTTVRGFFVPKVELRGWIWRTEFIKKRKIAGVGGHRIQWTQYLPIAECRQLGEFPTSKAA